MEEDSATSGEPRLLHCDDCESYNPEDKAQEQKFQPAVIEGTAVIAWLGDPSGRPSETGRGINP